MREIKFRGKSIETGEMIYGSLINNMFFKSNTKEPVFYIVDPDQFDDYDSFEDIEHLAVEVDPDTVGQYTELKDRNGKEIYEGDILECTAELLTNFGHTRTGKMATTLYQVKWLEEGWGKKVLKSTTLVFGHESGGVGISAKYSVVCGNIYTNPEMLGE